MIIKYVCIEEFEIPFCDEDGWTTERFSTVKKGSQWNLDTENTYTLTGAELRLENNNDELDWIELSNETLENCFIEMINEATVFEEYDAGPTIIVIPKYIPENEIIEEAKKCFKKYCDECLEENHDYYLDDKYSEIGIKRAMCDGDITDVATNVEEEILYKVWQVEINQYPF
ncbi:hypothetical protein AAA294_07210 [Fusobacterium varium]|uniref:hypothetical protein n=1 Tax=Fusobacterium varium TaxID=856 RepID=UPI0032C15851